MQLLCVVKASFERPVSFSFDTSFVDRISCSNNRCQSLEMLGRLASQLKFHAVNGKGAIGNESFVRHVSYEIIHVSIAWLIQVNTKMITCIFLLNRKGTFL